MYIKNQLIQKKLVLHLMEKEEFELLSFSNTREEYLLWKKEKRKTDIVRVSLNQYDWKRDLASSVETFEKRAVQQLRLPFLQERISFHHMFICENQPVDDWEELISSSGRANKIDQSYIYIYGKDKEEIDRFYQQSNVSSSFLFSVPENLLELEYQIELLKQRITQLHKEAEKEILAMFSKGKPRYSYVLLAINILVFLFLEYAGGSTNPEVLIEYGAKYNIAMMEGEWWRIITSMFLHIGVLHLALNMLALYFVGTLVERIYGNTRFLLIYFLAGIAGGIASFALNPSIAAGASGALFGLFGALLFFGIKFPKVFFKTMGTNVIFVVILNIVFGFAVQQVDNAAHIGGLIGGFIASWMVMFPKNNVYIQQLIALAVYAFCIFSMLTYGISNDEVQFNERMQIQRIQDLLQEEKYEKVIDISDQTLPFANDFSAEILFYRSLANVHLELYDKAQEDLEAAVQQKPNFEEAWYNLALIYQQNENYTKALAAIKQLLLLNPEKEVYQDLYKEI